MSIREKISVYLKKVIYYAKFFIFWLAAGGLTGVIGGAIGAIFSKTLSAASGFRSEHTFMLFMLPAAGIVIKLIYRLCGTVGSNTNTVFETVRDEKEVSVLLAPAVFGATVLTQLCGGSAGREGAALQIGGSLAALIGRAVRITEKQRHILMMCGMSALFSAMFGTPVGACIFAVEVVSVGRLYTAAMYPCMVSSIAAYGTALLLGVVPEHYEVGTLPEPGLNAMWQTAQIAILAAAVSILFCSVMHGAHRIFRQVIKNRYIRVAVGGLLIIGMTLIVGSGDYNGSGTDVIERIFEGGSVRPEAFMMKILFTAVTMGSGYKGGEIVPTLFIGASLGCTTASLIGINTAFGAALGMAAMFGGVTNCPITAILIAVELFGGGGVIYYMVAVLITYLLSGSFSLYSGQRIMFSKLDDEPLDGFYRDNT